MLIYICSSSHGFGHAARDVAVLRALQRLRPDWTLVLSCDVSPGFLRLVLGDADVLLRRCRWDVGMVQDDALGVNPQATLHALADLDRQLPDLIERESAWIINQGQPVCILGDVPPASADLAERTGAGLVWMGNFGWDDIYQAQGREGHGAAFDQRAASAREAYSRGQLLLRCPFDLAMAWGMPEQRIGLVCGEPEPLPAELEDRLLSLNVPLVQVGFGGLGLALDPQLFKRWPDHHFVMSASGHEDQSTQSLGLTNLTLLPQGVRPIDLFPYCQRHLGKPGFSTFSEVLSQHVGLHVVERTHFAEVSALMAGLQRHGRYRLLTRDQLNAGAWQLDQPLVLPSDGPLPVDGASQAAHALVKFAVTIR